MVIVPDEIIFCFHIRMNPNRNIVGRNIISTGLELKYLSNALINIMTTIKLV